MKICYKLLIATMAFACLSLNSLAFQSPSLPYDLFLVGIDSDIDDYKSDQLIVMAASDINSGFQFGLTNALSNDGQWETLETELEYINIKYTGTNVLVQGTALKINLTSSGIDILENGKSINDVFEISLSQSFNGDLINNSSFYFTVYSGVMTGAGSKHYLLGTSLDVLVYGISKAESQNIVLPNSVDNKEILLEYQDNSIAKIIEREDCNLCDILLSILFSDSWINIPNSFGFDLDPIPFDIRDCIEIDCPSNLTIDTLTCDSLYAKTLPCDSIIFYEWSKVVDSQFFPIESGTSGPIPNFEIPSSGLYQLTIMCADGCIDVSNLLNPECYEDDCDFDVTIMEDDCTVSIALTGCPDAQYQWFVQTSEDNYIIEGSNSSSITATQNGVYHAVITGCPNCAKTTSPLIDVNCGADCSCELNFYQENCFLYIDTTACIDFSGYIEFLSDISDEWIYLGAIQPIFNPSEYGNGMYRVILNSEECNDTLAQLYVDCFTPCDEVIIIPTTNNSCNLMFSWGGCYDPNFSIQYAEDCANYTNGGADLITSNILPDGTGSVEYSPLYSQGCYQLQLSCNDECLKYSDKIEIEDCCESELTIDTSNCQLFVSNIPCSGDFYYSIYANGEIIESGINSNNFSIDLDLNAILQVVIECNGCAFFSNVINANCGEEVCQTNPFLNIDECILTALIENCDSPQIQWQKFENATWNDISGENGISYEIIEDGTFRFVLVGCGCVEEPLFSLEYTSNCFIECDCEIAYDIDNVECVIHSANPGCELIISIEWYFEESQGNWIHQPQFSGQNSISPLQNGNYKKVINTKDCGQEIVEINISCIDECEEINLELGHVDCTIKVSWNGCYDLDSWEWTFTPESENTLDCGIDGTPEPAIYDVISETSSSITGIGSMEIKPLVDGCYTFTLGCNEDCTKSLSVEFETCCAPNAEIILDSIPDQLCDYCFVNQCTDSLFEIYVVIDAQTVPLSSFGEFDFPYCDNTDANGECGDTDCGDLPTFFDLVDDINLWFTEYGYEGNAQQGNGPGTCKGTNTPLYIQQSNIEFLNAYLWESLDWESTNSDGYQYSPFLQDACNEETEESNSLKIIGACLGAEFLWSTGETSQSIHYQEGQSYSATITCPDGCTELVTYGGSGVSSLNENKANQKSRIISYDNTVNLNENIVYPDIQFYPNPARSKVFFKVNEAVKSNLEVNLYTSHGKLITNQILPRSDNKTYEIDLTNFKSGVYMIHVKDRTQLLTIEKIVIIK